MSSPSFRFKQFEVYHDRCAMKVGMDAVSLGAWTSAPSVCSSPLRVLDVGAGSGLIALMLAQRFDHALIDAVEIDEQAAAQAAENMRRSPWPQRLQVHCASFPAWAAARATEAARATGPSASLYHLIVSNPPFFKGELRPSDEARNQARHVGSLNFENLTLAAASCLHPEGFFSVIIPAEAFDVFDDCAYRARLFLYRYCSLVSVEGKQAKRVMLTYAKTRQSVQREILVVKNNDGDYTSDYQLLTKDFYLDK